jgi:hypothetical protein
MKTGSRVRPRVGEVICGEDTHDKHSNSNRTILQIKRVLNPAAIPEDASEEDCERRIQRDLEQRVDNYYDGAEVDISLGELVPNHDHCDATGETDPDDPRTIGGEVGQRCVCAG